ncbi:D-alanyl-D-alanine carboxypeptidase [Streptomyces griseoloalbus]|uniref:D-alanyl-D-alanine carboxypeptidase n=1 Tax=Streptomyces griseoloalbus TaxID=67303 RepID=UPI003F53F16B
MAREKSSSESRGSVDTATRVLSVREATEDDAEAEDGSSAERDDSAAEGDDRLHEAAAVWVRSADSVDPVEDADGAARAEDASAEGGRPKTDAERTAAADGDPKTEDAADEDGTEGAGAPSAGARQEAPDAGKDTDTDDTGRETATEAPTGAQDGSGRAAAPTGATKAESAADEDGAGTEDAPSADARQEAPDTDTDADTDDTGRDTATKALTGAQDAADEDESAASGDAVGKTTSGAPEPASAADDSEDGDSAATAADDADEASEGGSGGAGSPAGEDGGPKADDAPAEPGAKSRTGEPEAKPEATESEATAPEADAKPKGPVDQPTAVFRTGRPSAPAVDQPTTMLKLGDARAGAGAESEAERTSKFVALKAYDDPGTRRPPRGGDVTTSVPQIGPERTTQQPLPPRPPLDLLAELTNTPPPPQTPLRTAVRRVKIWTPLVLLLVIVFAVVQNVRPLPMPTLELTAQDGYTFEGDKLDLPWPDAGQAALDVDGIGTFGSSGTQKPVPIASVAKVMTAYLVLRDHPLKSGAEGPMIEIDATAEKQSDAGQESTVDVTAGDEISQREAVESILIASANNVARLLARWDAGSEEAFVEKMNEAAKDLGMTDTTYTDPSGLNNTTVSTAVDQVKLAKAAMKQPAFREVAAMMEYIDYKNVKHGNWNRLVGHNDVVGIKTGTTTSALGNLVFAAKKDVDGEVHRIVGAVVRQPEGGEDNTILSGALSAGDQLIRAAQDALESATILKKGTVVGYADDGLGGRTPVAVTEDVKAVGWAGLSVKLTFAGTDLPHTAKAGTTVGTLTVGDGTSSAVKVPVALQEDLVEPGFADKLTRIA